MLSFLLLMVEGTIGFLSRTTVVVRDETKRRSFSFGSLEPLGGPTTITSRTRTGLNVWWFGGSPSEQTSLQDDESCELVAVRIERPSSNSRTILGEITIPVPLDAVWSILTDYDRLATHVPNLVESRIVQRPDGGEPGDGRFRCRLFQRGAQKIVGFEFGASVTMDMREMANDRPTTPDDNTVAARKRRIIFKCVDSFFFDEFDGEWTVVEQLDEDGKPESLLSYVVDVRPKGPVPVAALEWRIREDVPTNLRAVKKAATMRYEEARRRRLLRSQQQQQPPPPSVASTGPVDDTTTTATATTNRALPSSKRAAAEKARRKRLERVVVQWEQSETMAAYLTKP